MSSIRSFFQKTNLIRFLMILPINCNVNLMFGFAAIFNKNLGIQNIYFSGMLLSFPRIFSNLVIGKLMTKFRIKTLNLIVIGTSGALAAVLLVMNLIQNSQRSYSNRTPLYRLTESSKLISFRGFYHHDRHYYI